ncbi:MAG: GNAT family N-acetyltransferase [Deltaproteobacteria bacterium]|nr:GNAT family N-acetyltransferase [Deltaproteobacteria bacterium]MBW2254093.1 GNAT family N-acetyltransferase [Deltaproteobacteria bacterium]
MLLSRFDDDLRIEHLQTPEELANWRQRFIDSYRVIFRGPPYLEDMTEELAGFSWDYLTGHPGHITLVAVNPEEVVVGFGIAVPLTVTRLVAAQLAGLVPHKYTYYLAELGVLDAYRGRGLGRVLIHERIKLMDHKLYSHVVLRVSAKRHPSADLYESMGFVDMGVYMDVSNPRIDGTVSSDRRLFMSKVLSLVDVE